MSHAIPSSAEVLSGLCDFQKTTSIYAFSRLYDPDQPSLRFLVADEVGLGKTLVARGVIAQVVEHLRSIGDKRVDIVYICSNGAIARQNLRKLNIAGRLANIFITSKLTVLFVLACVLVGVLAVTLTPREENPQIIVPAAQIQVLLPGSSAAEVEELVIRPLEGDIKQITGVDHVYATAMNSVGVVMVQFKVGEDKEKSLVKLYDCVLGQRDRLPAEAGTPLIRSMDVDDVPVVTVTLASEKYDDYALKRLADRMIEGLRSQGTVSAAYVKGGRDREIRIELDPERRQAFGVTLDQVRSLIAAGNVSAPLGTQVQQGQNRKVVLDGFLTSDEDLKHLIVGGHAGRPIYLGDVAHIVDGPPEEREKLTRFAYGPADARFGKTQLPEMSAVTLAIAKKRGTNAVFFANDLLKRIGRMKAQFVPPGVDVVVTRAT